MSVFKSKCSSNSEKPVNTKGNKPSLLKGKSARAFLYNQVVSHGKLIVDQNGKKYVEYNGSFHAFAPLESQDMLDLLAKVGTDELSDVISSSITIPVRNSLRLLYDRFAETKTVTTRNARIDDDIYYALDTTDVIHIGNNKVEQAPSFAGLMVLNTANRISQTLPNLASPAEALPALLDHAFSLTEENKLRFYAHLVAFFVPELVVPVMMITGGHGTAKTTMSKKIIELVDPTINTAVAMPDSIGDLVSNLSNNNILPLDNITTINKSQSDILCIACTGGTFNKRMLFSDNTLFTTNIRCNVVFTCIGNPIRHTDLAERIDEFRQIKIKKRRTERAIWAEFNMLKPDILGSIFNVIAAAMPLVDQMEQRLKNIPRLADYCVYGAAFIQAMGLDPQKFVDEYRMMADTFVGECTSGDSFTNLVYEYISVHQTWKGTASMLLDTLRNYANGKTILNGFTASTLSRALSDRITDFQTLNIAITIKKKNPKSITLTYTGGEAE